MIRIAIADDHQSLIDGMLLMFSATPSMQVVLTGNDGKTVLDQIQYKKPDVVLTDIKMPVLDGIELCRSIKQKFPYIKVIAFTMFTQDEPLEAFKAAGGNGYLLKNAPLAEIVEAITYVRKNDYFYRPTEIVSENEKDESNFMLQKLTQSEQEILKLVAVGKSSSEIAEIRCSAVSTVDKHRKNMMRKLNLNGKGELIKFAFDHKYDL